LVAGNYTHTPARILEIEIAGLTVRSADLLVLQRVYDRSTQIQIEHRATALAESRHVRLTPYDCGFN